MKSERDNKALDNNILCPICSSGLIFKYINIDNKIFFCSNNKCIFPMGNNDMDKFIFNVKKDNLNDFIADIKKIIFEYSLSNDTNSEDKDKNGNKMKLISQDNSFNSDLLHNDDNVFFDSFSAN